MRTKKYKVNLTEEERKELVKITGNGKRSAKIIKRANILLRLDEKAGKVPTQEKIAKELNTTTTLIHKVSKEYVEAGLEKTLTRKKRETPPVPSKVTGEIEPKIIAIACSEPPQGKIIGR